MKIIAGILLSSMLAALPVLEQPSHASLVRAIVALIEGGIQGAPERSPHYRFDGPRYIDVGSFQRRIEEALGGVVTADGVLDAAGPAAAAATPQEALIDGRVREWGSFLQLDSLRAVRPGHDRLVAFVRWTYTEIRPANETRMEMVTGLYDSAFRLCLDPSNDGWSVVESRRDPPVEFRTVPPPLDCERLAERPQERAPAD